MLKVFKTDGGKGEGILWVTGSGEKERQGRWEQHVKARRGMAYFTPGTAR